MVYHYVILILIVNRTHFFPTRGLKIRSESDLHFVTFIFIFMNWQILDPHHVKAIECISLYKKLFSSEDMVVQIDMSKKKK